MSSFNAHNWFVDRETALTATETDLASIIRGAPPTGRVHMCGGHSRVEIVQFVVGAAGQSNTVRVYGVNPVGRASPVGIRADQDYLYIPIASIAFLSGLEPGIENAMVDETMLFADGIVLTEIAAAGYEGFSTSGTGDFTNVYSSTADDTGVAVLPLPACWGFVTSLSVLNSTSVNHLLKFS